MDKTEYYRGWIAAHPERKQEYRKTQKSKIRSILSEAKNRPCADCGIRYPSFVMQFDHLPGNEKKFNIGMAATNRISIDRLLEEIAKCEVVCANCHAVRTHTRRNSDR